MRSQISSLERSALQFTSGSITLAVVTLACLYLQAHFAATAFAYLLVVLLFSLMGSFVASSALCIVAIAALAYYFAPPAFSLRIDAPRDLPVVVAFFIASIVGAHLIGTLRQEREAARVIAAKLQRSAADLEDREKRWRAIFEHNPAMYFMVDEAGTVLDVNTFGATQLGYARAELIGQSVLEVFLEEDRACVRTCLKDVGQTRTWDVQKVRKDGSVLWVRESAKAMLWADKQPIVLIACEDITERRRTELALQRSEAHLAQAQELSHTGSFSWNPTTGEAFWSQETFRIFQLDRQTVPLGPQLVVERTHPDDRASVQEIIDRAMRDPSDFEHEYRLLLPDGSVKHIHAQARATRTASGEIEFVGAATDITAARRAEQQLRRNEAYLAEAQHLSHTGSWSWDVYGLDFVYRSAEVDRLFGFRPQEPVSIETIRSRIHPDDLPRLEEVQRQAIEHKEGRFEYDFRILLPDGGIRRIHSVAHVVVGSDGKVSELIGTHMDVTGQHAARERLENTLAALRESEQRFRDYAETASDWLWETGPDLQVTRLSEHTSAAGLLATGLIGLLRCDLACDVEEEPEKRRQHRATLEAHLPFRDLVYRTVNRTGSPIYVRTSGKPFFDGKGNFLGYRGVSTDITATIRADQAEQELRKAQAELAHVTRVTTLGELTTSIAHEVNQPLAAIISNADACLGWMGREAPNLSAARSSVEWIIEDAIRASEVIRRIRALAKKGDIEMVPLNINELVKEVIALVTRELVSHRVTLRTELTAGLPTILGDRIQLQQVIINLVMNGIEAMDAVTDRTRELLIQSSKDDLGHIQLAVTDCGVGIAEIDADRVLDPFFTTKSSGLGMGLSICRSIVEAHGGRLSMVHKNGPGATFQFALPLHKEAVS
ncbi:MULTISPECIES: PAS domain S-box protein [Bradyrhizobium]|jgi:PAS domain S-box-containing protein|uniref:histidine kinase n=1 Tax=Bradyrhizobium elkanii TaxID=29448 RepID=A0A4Q4JUP0_BRAEL|nr:MULTISPECIES: PAS domain S-box protein [Bradyrhizobium]MBP1294887.1 PAS domain S-box-containing protein [Bradyrhizobium elkanii]MCP1733680.1 PAS domain S-box-containing protein [Bradyrhizobium elkanii]MCP1751356.1 PAS domain S-box-containing protein [Bradyrhizobium elkanii]MCP1967341.1 PAS domain S-box-containing protein [Bradyrhizobium elkanii]MCP1977127.1 PAS domain S-box-containing protein [Bradyrhizobium elkanii]